MDSLTITIVGGVVVVVIGLFIEYGIIQKRKKNTEEKLSMDADNNLAPQLPDNSRATLTSSSGKSAADLPWPQAINKAVAEFRTLHTGKIVEVISTNAEVKTARLFIAVHGSGLLSSKYYSLVVNKVGDIISITQSR